MGISTGSQGLPGCSLLGWTLSNTSRRVISKGDLDVASRRELERHNAALVPGFVQGQWDGEASGLLKQKKKDFSDLHFFTYISARSCFWKPDARFDGPWGWSDSVARMLLRCWVMDVLLMVQPRLPIKGLHLNSNLYLFYTAYMYLCASVISKYLFVTYQQRSFTSLFTLLWSIDL